MKQQGGEACLRGRMGVSLGPFGGLLDPEAAHAAVEIGPIGLQHPRGLGHVALGLRLNAAADEPALVIVQRLGEGQAPSRRPGAPEATDPPDRQHAAHGAGIHRIGPREC